MTILFKDDWIYKHPGAIVDLKTSNHSFIRLASLYREMGVENHAFPLALHNPMLQGVDPFAENLTLQQIGMISLECKDNVWYFMREIARAPALSGNENTPVEANRANICLFWCFLNHIFIFLIQPRQTGKSFNTDLLMRWLINVVCVNTEINLVTKDDSLRRANVQRLKAIGESLPFYLQHKRFDDSNNGEEITVKTFGNIYKTHVPQSSPKNAYKLGRGLTSAVMHFDEPPYQPNIEIALTSALGAIGAAVDKAKANNAPYGTIMTTTAGKKDDRDGKYVYQILSEAAVWTERFLDAKNAEELEKMVRKASRGKNGGVFRINATFSHRQLGKSDEWLAEKLESNLQTGDDANRDFFNIWTAGSESSPFPIDVSEKISKCQIQPFHTSISSELYTLRWYVPEELIEEYMANGQFVAGMDTSDASGGDDISLVVIDTRTLRTVCVGTFNETNLILFAKWVCSFLVKYKNVTAIIERRSTGSAVLDFLLYMLPQYGEDPFRRLFNRIVHDADEFPDRFREVIPDMNKRDPELYTRYKKQFGFATSGSGMASRGELYSTTLQRAVRVAGERTLDVPLINQILGLVIRNGRVDHAVGDHDDLVIGWLLANWLLTLGKNLDFYGMDPRVILSEVAPRKVVSMEEERRINEQRMIREKITQVHKQLSDETDDYICIQLENQLRHLNSKLVLEDNELFSLDAVIRDAQEKRSNMLRQRTQYAQDYNYNSPGYGRGYGQIAGVPSITSSPW